MTKNIIIAGNPGGGKTALIKEIIRENRGECGGFYTEPMRGDDPKRGFLIKTLDGKERVFASKIPEDLEGGRIVKLKKYKVDLDAVEEVAVAAAEKSAAAGIITVVDEIGSMELLSEAFRAGVPAWLESESVVVAAVRLNSRHFTDVLKNRSDCAVFDMTSMSPEKIIAGAEHIIRAARRFREAAGK